MRVSQRLAPVAAMVVSAFAQTTTPGNSTTSVAPTTTEYTTIIATDYATYCPVCVFNFLYLTDTKAWLVSDYLCSQQRDLHGYEGDDVDHHQYDFVPSTLKN